MNSASNNDDALARQSSQSLDTDDHQQSTLDSTIPAEQQMHVADLQLVDALLANLSDNASEQRTDRIRRVMAAIDSIEPSPKRHRQFVYWKSTVAVAASLLVAFGLFWTQFADESRANVILQQVGEVVLEKIDRVYHFRRNTSHSDHPQQLDGKLYLRGRDGFALRCGDVILGRGADEYWLVPKHGEVVLADNFEWIVADSEQQSKELGLLKHLSADSRRVPIMQLSAVVDLMKHDYDVTLTVGEYRDQSIDSIVGTLRSGVQDLPDTITLWADTDSRIIRRAEISWGPGNTLTLELAPTESVSPDWYMHETHHDGQRVVRRVAAEPL